MVKPVSAEPSAVIRSRRETYRHGDLRRALPMFYQRAWTDVFTPSFDPAPLRHGALWSLVYVVAFVGLGYTGFRRKDVLS
mgnify:CR=1 FL=1